MTICNECLIYCIALQRLKWNIRSIWMLILICSICPPPKKTKKNNNNMEANTDEQTYCYKLWNLWSWPTTENSRIRPSVKTAISQFPGVGRCHSCLNTPTLSSARSKKDPHICRWNIDSICHISRDKYTYFRIDGWMDGWMDFRFPRPCCHFRLSAFVSIARRHFFQLAELSKSADFCRWNFDAVCDSSQDISSCGFLAVLLFPVVHQFALNYKHFLWAS